MKVKSTIVEENIPEQDEKNNKTCQNKSGYCQLHLDHIFFGYQLPGHLAKLENQALQKQLCSLYTQAGSNLPEDIPTEVLFQN